MPRLHVVIVSTRPQRTGVPVAEWFVQRAQQHGKFEVRRVDLKELNLPLLDEPKHPRLRQYQHAHTKAWSESVDAADAFVFVTPEYNFAVPAPLVNAIDYLFSEWHYKPVGFVSYGGVSGGLRSVQMAKLLVTSLKMMPLPETVSIPMVHQALDESGSLKSTPALEDSATKMLEELSRWEGALRTLRK
jgi:NAD(P)H-dependent FMN reductase